MKQTLLGLAVIASLFTTANAMDKAYSMNKKHELVRPTDYRTWVYVGTPVTPNELNNGKAAFPEMHNVYIDPVSYKMYKESGKFREGTVIIKELVSVGATSAVSGKGYFEGDFLGLEVSIKSKKDFPSEPGNWAIFSFSDMKTGILKETAPVLPANMCVSCHQANAEDDFVFTQYYPVLKAAKGFGKQNPESVAQRSIPKMNKK
ncbi:Cytochrome P460 [hydrothermal vent metagenome]|uniref:Cytochrome P460 n=1 Tax=hydrothermal vent metagenome TaxID=652676 RepID=A0A1W1CW03_9ZZZZ